MRLEADKMENLVVSYFLNCCPEKNVSLTFASSRVPEKLSQVRHK